MSLSSFGIMVILTSLTSWKVFSSIFLMTLCKIGHFCQGDYNLVFFLWEGFQTMNSKFNRYRVGLVISSWAFVVCVFQEICPFHLNYQMFGIKLFIIFYYSSFNVSWLCRNVSCFIPDINHLCLLFFMINLSRDFQFYLSFQSTNFDFIGFLHCISVSLLVISALHYSFLLFTLCLTRSSSSSFLK